MVFGEKDILSKKWESTKQGFEDTFNPKPRRIRTSKAQLEFEIY